MIVGGVMLVAGTAYAGLALDRPPTPDRGALMTDSERQVEYDLWRGKLELPPGVQWLELSSQPDVSFGGNAGVMAAFDQAIGAWSREWIAAAEAGNAPRAAAAAAQLAAIRGVMPVFTEGMSENQGGYESALVELFDSALKAAGDGDFTELRSFADWGSEPELPAGTERARTAEWIAGGEEQTMGTRDEMLAGFREFAERIELPPGVAWVEPSLPAGEEYSLMSSSRLALMYAWTSWWREWIAAVEAGDDDRIAAAQRASAQIGEMLPAVPAPGSEESTHEWLALSEESIADYRLYDDRARHGDLEGIKAWVRQQECVEGVPFR
jgi:hypothetical protein